MDLFQRLIQLVKKSTDIKFKMLVTESTRSQKVRDHFEGHMLSVRHTKALSGHPEYIIQHIGESKPNRWVAGKKVAQD